MKTKFIGLLLIISLISCKKEEVQLPKSDISVQTELLDHSPVYMFFTTENNDTIADVNKNNTISSTNWVYNIDKRLPLHTVIPEIIKLQDKKEGSSHKKEGAINVFSYADSLHKNLAFYPFTEVKFFYDDQFSKFYIKEHMDLYKDYNNLYINFKKDGTVTVDGTEIDKAELTDFLKDFSDFTSNGRSTILHMNFDKHLTYNDYILNKILVWKASSDIVQLSAYEFIYDAKRIPDCGCTL